MTVIARKQKQVGYVGKISQKHYVQRCRRNKKTKDEGDRVSQHKKDAEQSDQDLSAENDADYKQPQEDVTTGTETKETKDAEDDSATIKGNELKNCDEPNSIQGDKDEEEIIKIPERYCCRTQDRTRK